MTTPMNIPDKPETQQLFDRKNVENIYPLSPMQHGLLFHSLLAPHAGAYVPQIVISLKGELDSIAMKTAWQTVANRHGMLRSGYFWQQRDEPYQILFKQLPINWVEQDWSNLTVPEQNNKLETLMACNRTEPFNLQRPPLVRLHWLKTGSDKAKLIFCYHHVILDGWSASLLLKEVIASYQATNGAGAQLSANVVSASAKELPTPPSPPYVDYIKWLKQQDQVAALNHWKSLLANSSVLPTLPGRLFDTPMATKHKKPAEPNNCLLETELDDKQSAALHDKLKQRKVTLNSLLQTALALLLRRYGNQGDIQFGTTVSGRPASLANATSMVGLFINTIPVKVSIDAKASVQQHLEQVQNRHLENSEFDFISLRELQTQCNDGQPLFNCLLVVENYPTTDDFNSTRSAHTAITQTNHTLQKPVELESISFDENTHLPLTLQVSSGALDKPIRFAARFDSNQFQHDIIEQFLNHFKQLVNTLIQNTHEPIKALELLSDTEKKQRHEWNSTAAEFPQQKTLADLFEQQAEATPEQIAVIEDEKSLTYQQLNLRGNVLATTLADRNIGPESIVAVNLQRSLELAVALIAIQKVGAVWLPLETDQPVNRLQGIIEDAAPALLIHHSLQESNASGFATNVPRCDLAQLSYPLNDKDVALNNPVRNSDTYNGKNAAYLIYTSGSTGKPKGVINTQEAIVNRLHWMQKQYELTQQDRVLHKTPLSFDVSIWELFWPLITGATQVMAKPKGHLDRNYLARCIAEHQVSVLHFVPTMLTDFLNAEALTNAPINSLRDVICSGEALTAKLQNQFFSVFNSCRLHNLYGPTEAAIDVTAWQCVPNLNEQQQRIPIGKPIDNIQIHLVDPDGQACPIGGIGKLLIGGIGVARGYLNKPELNETRFITSPKLGKVYDTGDLACYLRDGNIVYLGRQDDQIKLRGVRIELGEIENQMSMLPNVQQAAVMLSPQNQLVGFVVTANGSKPSEQDLSEQAHSKEWSSELRQALRQSLPEAMVPSEIFQLDSLPTTTNGKPDRAKISKHYATLNIGTTHYESPDSQQEKLLAEIWRDVLRLSELPSRNASFFQLGGHSLIATRIINRIRQATDVELPLTDIFEFPTLSELALRIRRLQEQTDDNDTTETTKGSGYREVSI
ncbi:MAG: amino acid adenylation domain-containing protein [Pseudomonadales bacterium]|nr:amino acid adenylation domain-containing protein [Pseudomonadales bacterium]